MIDPVFLYIRLYEFSYMYCIPFLENIFGCDIIVFHEKRIL